MNTNSLTLVAASGQYVATNNNPTNINVTTSYTFEAWVKVTTLSTLMSILGKGTVGTNGLQYFLQINRNTAGKFSFLISTDGLNIGSGPNDNNTAIAINVWNHIAITYDGTTFQWYLNGTADGNRTLTSTAYGGTGVRLVLGADEISNTIEANFDGKLDEIRIWNTARSGADILANYQRELAGNESGLVAYYKLNNNYNDATSNANNLITVSGLPSFTSDVPFADSTTTSTSTTSTSSSSSTTTTSTSTTSTSTSKTTSTSTTSTSTSRTTSTTTTKSLTTSTSTTSTSSSTTTTSTSTTSTSTSITTSTSMSTSTTTTLDFRIIVEKIK